MREPNQERPGELRIRPGPDPPAETLESLLTEVRSGSQEAYACVVQTLWAPLVRYARAQLGDLDAAQDAVQEVLVDLWQRRRAWTPRGSARAYVFRMTRSKVIDERRKRQARLRGSERWRRRAESTCRTPSDDLDATLALEAIARALTTLPARRREVFTLVHMEGLTHSEAAQVMGITVQTVANQMTAALRSLREELRKTCPAR